MNVIETGLPGLKIIEPMVFEDSRGYFLECFHKRKLEDYDCAYEFVQDNESKSVYGVIRGLHFQKGEHSQAKRVRVVYGEVLDVVLDLRKESPTFGQCYSQRLSGDNKLQLMIPRGFAHGFAVLSQECIFTYSCDNYYHADAEAGIDLADSELGIDWQIPIEERIISDRDKSWPPFAEREYTF